MSVAVSGVAMVSRWSLLAERASTNAKHSKAGPYQSPHQLARLAWPPGAVVEGLKPRHRQEMSGALQQPASQRRPRLRQREGQSGRTPAWRPGVEGGPSQDARPALGGAADLWVRVGSCGECGNGHPPHDRNWLECWKRTLLRKRVTTFPPSRVSNEDDTDLNSQRTSIFTSNSQPNSMPNQMLIP